MKRNQNVKIYRKSTKPMLSSFLSSYTCKLCIALILGTSGYLNLKILLSEVDPHEKQLTQQLHSLERNQYVRGQNDPMKSKNDQVVDEAKILALQNRQLVLVEDAIKLDRQSGKEKQESKQMMIGISSTSNEDYIPNQFHADLDIFSINSFHRRPFPRWQSYPDTDQSRNEPTIMESLLDFASAQSNRFGEVDDLKILTEWFNSQPHTNEHQFDTMGGLPEMLYVFSIDGLYVSETSRKILALQPAMVYEKFTQTHKLLSRAYKTFRQHLTIQQPSDVRIQFPSLYQTTMVEHQSIPFYVWHGDYTGCNYHNWKNKKIDISQTVLLFTVAANVQCNYTFPIPNYQTCLDAYENGTDWQELAKQEEIYKTWKEKIPQLVWRGGLTGKMPQFNLTERGPRYHLVKLVHSESALTEDQRRLFDVKLIRIERKNRDYINVTELGGEAGNPNSFQRNVMKMSKFRNYRAILDIDGYSWSSRFGKLLCYQSVILKVEPKYVDYFQYKSATRSGSIPILQPWVHYIPIRYDLKDLVEKTQYAVNDANEEIITRIIHNANAWCSEHMTQTSVTYDMLHVLDKYVETLNDYSPQWKQQWYNVEQTIMNSPLRMRTIEG